MDTLSQVIIKTVKILGGAGMFSVLAIMLIMTGDVILRYIFNDPILWAYDATEYLMLGFTYFALAYAEYRGDHVNIDMIFVRLRKKTQTILNLINRLIMLVIAVLITNQAWLRMISALRHGRTAPGPVKIPQAPAEAAIFIGCLVLCFLLIIKIHAYGCQLFDVKLKFKPWKE